MDKNKHSTRKYKNSRLLFKRVSVGSGKGSTLYKMSSPSTAARGQPLLGPLRSTVMQGLIGSIYVQATEISQWPCYLYVRNSPSIFLRWRAILGIPVFWPSSGQLRTKKFVTFFSVRTGNLPLCV